MGFYDRHILPWLLDHAMRRPALAPQRQSLLSDVRGEVLEIGFGSGLNLPFYPDDVRRITAVEPSEGMTRRAADRIRASGKEVRRLPLGADRRLPLPDNSFDAVVSTWTMCSIPDVSAAFREVHRVLKPGGRFLFLEHGLSPDARVARWQHRLTPVMRRLGGGCHLDRDPEAIVRASPLSLERCEKFYLPGEPRLGGYTYRGAGVKMTR
jgi:ubiquinone/menaquinone biosynthesis C-methylase UbiE